MNYQPNISILIADDESSIRNGLLSAIPWEDLHMTVLGTAKDGMEAWDFIQSCHPEIVITDIRMPHLNGLELIKRCRDHHLDIQFILLSGYDDFTYAQTAIHYGARAYVLKPLKREELIAELENLAEELAQSRNKEHPSDRSDSRSFQELSCRLFFNQLIHNEFHHSSDIKQRLLELHSNLEDTALQIIIFFIQPEDRDRTCSILSAIQELIEYLPSQVHAQVWESDSSHIIVLLPISSSSHPLPAQYFAKECLRQLKEEQGYQLSVGIGPIESSLIHAGHSYGMALTALSYRLYESGQDIYDQDVICTQAPSISTNSIDTGELIHAIRKNDASAIETYCRHFFRSLLYVPMPPPSFIRGMSIYLVTDVQNALRKQTEHASLFVELPYGKINQLETFQELMTWSILLFQQYGESLSPYLCIREDSVILQAKQFIQDHMNRKIQAEDVASFVNLSPSYFAIYFKSKTGTNFRDYVSGIKMEYAKHLLATANANISEVSYAVGYDDYRSFYRAFKNYTGMTPSEYQAKYEL